MDELDDGDPGLSDGGRKKKLQRIYSHIAGAQSFLSKRQADSLIPAINFFLPRTLFYLENEFQK